MAVQKTPEGYWRREDSALFMKSADIHEDNL